MIVRAFVVLLAAFAMPPTLPATAETPASATRAAPAMTDEELMRVTALDEVFTEFGASIEQSPTQQGIPFPGSMAAAWTAAAREVFDAARMHRSLAEALAGKFSPADYEAFGAFFLSDFGTAVTEIERAVTTMPADRQMAARDAGIALSNEAAGTRRAAQIEEMLALVGAEITRAMVRQSVRGMLIGMSMTDQQGDIEVPWEEIDAQLSLIMPGIEADVALTQQAMMYFAYRDLSDADVETYLEFLRTEPAKKFYAVAAFAIGEIVAERMETFGEALARKLDQVNV
jgi:hypothetical protein